MKIDDTQRRTVEPSGNTKHQIQDKGYKKLFQNKEIFLEFLHTFIHEEWVKDIQENDLIRVDKEYVLEDYRKKESDIVYRMKLKHPTTGQEKEVIFYILLELQSRVDRMMPYRLLMYMIQIWKQDLTNITIEETNKKDFKLPAIIPIVLYNGASEWDAGMQFRDLQNASERFGEYVVDFKYILVNTNSYTEADLLNISNAISCIIMMDQSVVGKDKDVMIRRLNEIIAIKDQLPVQKMDLIFEWLMEVLMKRFPEKEVKKIIQSMKEGKTMTYAIERLFDEAEEKGKIETAKVALIEGLPIELIKKLTGLEIEKIEELQRQIVH